MTDRDRFTFEREFRRLLKARDAYMRVVGAVARVADRVAAEHTVMVKAFAERWAWLMGVVLSADELRLLHEIQATHNAEAQHELRLAMAEQQRDGDTPN